MATAARVTPAVRLRIVAYYFPPAGGAGVQRILKWVKYLPALGVVPIVITVDDGAFSSRDPSLLEEVPEDVTVIRTASLNPFSWYARITRRPSTDVVAGYTDEVGTDPGLAQRAARWIRANVMVPDARVGWVPFARRAASRAIADHDVDAVLTSGPPHSAHLVAQRLDRPWIADFRDPWTDIHYAADLPRTRLATRLDRRLESQVLRKASAITTVSPHWAALLEERRGAAVSVIHNGFDPADFDGDAPVRDNAFTVAHVGSLYASRNPIAFWRAVARLNSEFGEETIRIRVVGRTSPEVRESARAHGVNVEWVPYVLHDAAVREMRSAHLLLLSTEPHGVEQGHITGKLYEYLASGRPVLGLGSTDGDAATLLARAGAGRMFERSDQDGVFSYVYEHAEAHRRGENLAGARWSDIAAYSRQNQAKQLAALVRSLVERRGVRR